MPFSKKKKIIVIICKHTLLYTFIYYHIAIETIKMDFGWIFKYL